MEKIDILFQIHNIPMDVLSGMGPYLKDEGHGLDRFKMSGKYQGFYGRDSTKISSITYSAT